MNRSTVSLFDAIETIASTCRKPAALLVMTLSVALGAEAGLFDAFKSTDSELEAVRAKNAATPVVPVLQTRSIAPGSAPVSELAAPAPAPVPVPVPTMAPVPASTPAAAPVTASASDPSPAARAVAAAAAPVPDAAVLAATRTTATKTEVPKIDTTWGSVKVVLPATPEQIAEARAAWDKGKKDDARPELSIEKVDDATLAAVIGAFPDTVELTLARAEGFTTLEPLALLRDLKRLTIDFCTGVKTFAPLAGLVRLESLKINNSKVGDTSFFAGLTKLEKVALFTCEVKDFAALAGLPELRELNYYGATTDQAGYDTLGLLKQVTEFEGGMTKMTSAAWVKNVPQAEYIQFFNEAIDDLSPVAALVNLKRFRAWNMAKGKSSGRDVGDLKFLSGCTKLTRLELPGSRFSNVAALATLANLEYLELGSAENDIDLSFVKGLAKLKRIDVSDCGGTVSGLEAVQMLPELEKIDLRRRSSNEKPGPTSLAGLEACPKLTDVVVTEKAFPEAEVKAVDAVLKKRSQYGGVEER